MDMIKTIFAYVLIISIQISVFFLIVCFKIDKANDTLKRIEKKLDSAEKDRVRE